MTLTLRLQATAAVATAAVAPGYGGVAQGQDGEKKEVEEKPIDPNFVLSWLLDNEILKLLFTNTHVELIRQSLGILNFLVSKNKLAVEDLDMLWEASLGRHESEKRVIFETIVSLGQNLPYKTIGTPRRSLFATRTPIWLTNRCLLYSTDHIFSRIMETPINGYDAETVILVHDFTVIGIKANVRSSTSARSRTFLACRLSSLLTSWDGTTELGEEELVRHGRPVEAGHARGRGHSGRVGHLCF